MSLHWRTDVEAVLRDAAADGRDILLWWTAPWCPPCNELDYMVLAQPAFADIGSTLHLLKIEADAPGAQRWGDHFGLESYPALWLLSAEAQPRMAMPMASDPTGMLHAIHLAQQQRPLREIAGSLLRGETIPASERELIALHWWQQDRQLLPAPDQRAALLSTACRQASDDPIPTQLRLLVHWMTAMRGLPASDTAPPLWDAALQLRGCLESDDIRFADTYLLWVDPAQVSVLGHDVERVLEQTCLDAVSRQLQRDDLQRTQRLVARFAQLQLADMLAANALLMESKRTGAAEAEQVLREVSDPAEWVSVANMAGHLLGACDEGTRARQVFETAAARAEHPGYFLQYLGDLQLDAGDIGAGLATWRQAHEASKGSATRFAMGVRLIRRLIKHAPLDVAGIDAAIAAVLADLGGSGAPICGSNRRNLRQLQDEINAWQQQVSHAERGCDGASCPA